jgi:hypothetical protein
MIKQFPPLIRCERSFASNDTRDGAVAVSVLGASIQEILGRKVSGQTVLGQKVGNLEI